PAWSPVQPTVVDQLGSRASEAVRLVKLLNAFVDVSLLPRSTGVDASASPVKVNFCVGCVLETTTFLVTRCACPVLVNVHTGASPGSGAKVADVVAVSALGVESVPPGRSPVQR